MYSRLLPVHLQPEDTTDSWVILRSCRVVMNGPSAAALCANCSPSSPIYSFTLSVAISVTSPVNPYGFLYLFPRPSGFLLKFFIFLSYPFSNIFLPVSRWLPFLPLILINISLFFYRSQPHTLPFPFVHCPPTPTALLTFFFPSLLTSPSSVSLFFCCYSAVPFPVPLFILPTTILWQLHAPTP